METMTSIVLLINANITDDIFEFDKTMTYIIIMTKCQKHVKQRDKELVKTESSKGLNLSTDTVLV
jgi:hypothetical protein